MEEVTSNTTIAVMVVHLACYEEVYLGPKPKKVGNRVKGRQSCCATQLADLADFADSSLFLVLFRLRCVGSIDKQPGEV